MYIDFELLPLQSRVWVFSADRTLNELERDVLKQKASTFCNQWTSHRVDLTASFKILYSNILVLATDEEKAGASGCSIDSSVHWLKEVEQELKVSFLNRFIVTYMNNGEMSVVTLKFFLEQYGEEERQNLLIVNTDCKTKNDINSHLLIPFANSTLSKVDPEILAHSFLL